MGIFSGGQEKGELSAVFDIGSSSVGGALFFMHKSKVPEIVFSFRESVTLDKQFNFDKFLSRTMTALDDVSKRMVKAGHGSPKKFFCVLASPWYGSQTRVVRLEKNTPFVFTSKLADELIDKEVNLFKEEHLEQYQGSEGKVLPIELKNMKTMLNGYETAEPINQKAHELEMTFFVSMSSEKFLGTIQEIIAKHFHRENVKFSSFAMASFAVARDIFVNQDNFLLIDIGGEVTDISMVKHDILSNSISFPLGVNFIIRDISETFNCSTEEARSLFSLYKDGHAAVETLKTLEPLMTKLKSDWLTGFQNSLANLSKDISVPADIFITVDQEYANFYSEIIKAEQFSQYTLAESKFKISFLGTAELHNLVTFKKDIARDPFLVLESIYINRFLR